MNLHGSRSERSRRSGRILLGSLVLAGVSALIACQSDRATGPEAAADRLRVARYHAGTGPAGSQLQARFTDPEDGVEVQVYGSYSDATTPGRPAAITVRRESDDTATVLLLDGRGVPTTIYRAHRNGGKGNVVLQFASMGADSMSVTGYRYDWSIGVGTRVFKTVVTRAAGGIRERLVAFDSLSAADPMGAAVSIGRPNLALATTPSDAVTVPAVALAARESGVAGGCSWAKQIAGAVSNSIEVDYLRSIQGAIKSGATLTGGAAIVTGLSGIGAAATPFLAGASVLLSSASIFINKAPAIKSWLGDYGSACDEDPEREDFDQDPPTPPTPLPEDIPEPELAPFIGGGMAVIDNGSNPGDDAFALSISSALVARTYQGSPDPISVGALLPGSYTISLDVLVAPDNLGTFLVVLSGGLRFADGSTQRSGTAPQGARRNFLVIVPSNSTALGARVPNATDAALVRVPEGARVQEEAP